MFYNLQISLWKQSETLSFMVEMKDFFLVLNH